MESVLKELWSVYYTDSKCIEGPSPGQVTLITCFGQCISSSSIIEGCSWGCVQMADMSDFFSNLFSASVQVSWVLQTGQHYWARWWCVGEDTSSSLPCSTWCCHIPATGALVAILVREKACPNSGPGAKSGPPFRFIRPAACVSWRAATRWQHCSAKVAKRRGAFNHFSSLHCWNAQVHFRYIFKNIFILSWDYVLFKYCTRLCVCVQRSICWILLTHTIYGRYHMSHQGNGA